MIGNALKESTNSCENCLDSNCLSCVNNTLNTCSSCKPGYYVDLVDDKCYKQCTNPGEALVKTSNTCESCLDSNCLSCVNNTLNGCTSCGPGTYLDSGVDICYLECPNDSEALVKSSNTCEPCSDVNCLQCLNDTLACTECKDNFGLKADQSCVTDCGTGYGFRPS